MKYLLVLITLLSVSAHAEVFNRNQTSHADHHNDIKNPKQKERVVMFSTNHCYFCKQARTYFKAHNIPYVERNLDRSIAAVRQFKAMNGFGTPLILMGKRQLIGFSVPRFQQFYR